MRKSRAFPLRMDASRLLGEHKAVEAVPYLEEAMRSDGDGNVRGSAWAALKNITGKTYDFVNPDDIEEMKRLDEYEKKMYEERKK
ncbi:MAG: hypothetical protein HY934_05680 [Candidatus Firestonebacteria bacterium]|nr:hypothetical protein [Candidatus Firestonebacteria bacterium]